MARLIGTELIEKAEVSKYVHLNVLKELRINFNSLYEIWCEMEDSSEQQRKDGFTFDQKNSDFLNKEITFFVDNLRKVFTFNEFHNNCRKQLILVYQRRLFYLCQTTGTSRYVRYTKYLTSSDEYIKN